MSARPVRVSDLSGAAPAGVTSARGGETADIPSPGETVTRVVPVDERGDETLLAGMRMTGTGTSFRLPARVGKMEPGAGMISDQVVADRSR